MFILESRKTNLLSYENRISRQVESPSKIWDQTLEFQKPIHLEAKEVSASGPLTYTGLATSPHGHMLLYYLQIEDIFNCKR